MRVSMPMAQFVTWVGVALVVGLVLGLVALPVLRFIARRRAERVPAAGDGPVDPFVPFR